MTAKPLPSIASLLRASSDDQIVLELEVPDSAFGFHAQQAVEKLYKVLLQRQAGTYPFIHDLRGLRDRVEAAGYVLPVCAFSLERLSEYAADARYEDPIVVDPVQRQMLRECVATLRAFVMLQVE